MSVARVTSERRRSLPSKVLIPLVLALPLAGCFAMPGGPAYIRPPMMHDDRNAWPGGWGWRPPGRYVRAGRDVVCDRSTQLCYKRGRVDVSETRDAFGRGAARDADALRDRLGTAHVFVPRGRGDRYCINAEKTCYKNGRPDWSDTRDVYGKEAARRLRGG
jgi:hypothetical protein